YRQLNAVSYALTQQRSQGLAVVEVGRDQDCARHVWLVDVELLQESRKHLSRVEGRLRVRRVRLLPGIALPQWFRGDTLQQLRNVFPKELAPIHDLSVAHVEQVDRQAASLEVIPEHVGI